MSRYKWFGSLELDFIYPNKNYIVHNWNKTETVWAGCLYAALGDQCDRFDLILYEVNSQLAPRRQSWVIVPRGYITAQEVLKESTDSWNLLKINGIVIFFQLKRKNFIFVRHWESKIFFSQCESEHPGSGALLILAQWLAEFICQSWY